METTIKELQAFEHLAGTVSYDGDNWCVIIKADNTWVDAIFITEAEKNCLYDVMRTPNLSTPVQEIIAALKAQ